MVNQHKPAELFAEWEALGKPADRGFYDRLAGCSIETLVTACRVYGSVDGERLYEQLLDRVVPRFTMAVRRLARMKGHRLSVYDLDEVEETLAQTFWEKVLKTESFFEIRFNLALKKLTLTVYRNVIEGAQRRHERTATRIVASEGKDVEAPWAIDQDHLRPDLVDETGRVDGRLAAAALLGQLPDDVARAVALHVLADLKIYSTNPTEPTVASILGCKERKARQLVADGLTLLRELSGDEVDEVGDG